MKPIPSGVVILCGKLEAGLAELEAVERAELLSSYGLTEPALAMRAAWHGDCSMRQ